MGLETDLRVRMDQGKPKVFSWNLSHIEFGLNFQKTVSGGGEVDGFNDEESPD